MDVRRWIGGAAAGTLVAAAMAIPAVAQDDAAEPPPREPLREERQAAFVEALADELGLPAADVAAALDAVEERFRSRAEANRLERLADRLGAAVRDGRLTQDQADAILEAARSGVFLPGVGPRRGPLGPFPPFPPFHS